jgi:hypothetical protein
VKKGRREYKKKTRRGSSVGTTLPHCHLLLQVQAVGSSAKEKDETEREKKRTGRVKRNGGRHEGELGSIGRWLQRNKRTEARKTQQQPASIVDVP